MVDIKTSGRILLKDGKRVVELSTEATDALVINQLIVILLKNVRTDDDRNIVCYDLDGNFKWQVSKLVKLHSKNYFVGIEVRADKLYAYSISGIEYCLNPISGEVLESQLVK